MNNWNSCIILKKWNKWKKPRWTATTKKKEEKGGERGGGERGREQRETKVWKWFISLLSICRKPSVVERWASGQDHRGGIWS